MRWVKTVMGEVIGLFFDDGRFAVTILLWVGIVALILPRAGFPAAWNGPLLFLGLALILIESTIRRAGR